MAIRTPTARAPGRAFAVRQPACGGLPRGVAGAGFKPQHFEDVCADARGVGFFEVHAENYMGAGGPPHQMLARLRTDFPLSIHGVGLSLGGADRPDPAHLARLRKLCARYEPAVFSEHLAWSSHRGVFLNDLLPVAYEPATARRVAAHVAETQDALGRTLLLENPSVYVGFRGSVMDEVEFLAEISATTGCGLLLDVNNVHVSANNAGFDAAGYIARFPADRVGEIHIAGFTVDESPGPCLLIDTHGAPVDRAVWRLLAAAIERAGNVPVLLERDNDVPPWPVLAAEAAYAADIAAAAGAPARGVA